MITNTPIDINHKMDALDGDNLTGKSVTGTLQHGMGKWFKK